MYKYNIVSIYAKNKKDIINIQLFLFDNGFRWASKSTVVKYLYDNSLIFNIYLDEKIIRKLDSFNKNSALIFFKNNYMDNHELIIHDTEELWDRFKNIIMYNTSDKPSYNPKIKNDRKINESINKKPLLILIKFDSNDDIDKFKNYCDSVFKYVKVNLIGREYLYDMSYTYGVYVINDDNLPFNLNKNNIYFSSNNEFFENGRFQELYEYKSIIHDSIINSKDKNSFLKIIKNESNIELNIPFYDNIKNKRLLESNIENIPNIYCDNRQHAVELEDFLHKNGFVYRGGGKYFIRNNEYYQKITICDINLIDKDFIGGYYKKEPWVNYSDIKNVIRVWFGLEPTYKPKRINRGLD